MSVFSSNETNMARPAFKGVARAGLTHQFVSYRVVLKFCVCYKINSLAKTCLICCQFTASSPGWRFFFFKVSSFIGVIVSELGVFLRSMRASVIAPRTFPSVWIWGYGILGIVIHSWIIFPAIQNLLERWTSKSTQSNGRVSCDRIWSFLYFADAVKTSSWTQ